MINNEVEVTPPRQRGKILAHLEYMDVLKTDRNRTTSAIASDCGLSYNQARYYLKQLKKWNRIEEHPNSVSYRKMWQIKKNGTKGDNIVC
jgi:predicted transcriptional regulator